MTVFSFNSLGLASTTTASSATDSLTDALEEEDPSLGTTALGLSTALAISAQNNINVETTKYVESLSDSEIARYIELIEERNAELDRREYNLQKNDLTVESDSIGKQK